jgi:hypothetical protein
MNDEAQVRDDDKLAFTVGSVWRDERVSCPHPDILKAWVGGSLPADAAEFVAFHLDEAACPYCNAVLAELRARDEDAAQAPLEDMRGRLLRSTVTFLRRAGR